MKALSKASIWLEAWLLWLAVTSVGWPLGALALSVIGERLPWSDAPRFIAGALVSGFFLGLTQWLFLRPPGPSAATWVLASAVGLLGAVAVAIAIVAAALAPLWTAILVALTGIIMAAAQALTLRPQPGARADWASLVTFGWAAIVLVGFAAGGRAFAGNWTSGWTDGLLGLATIWILGALLLGPVAAVLVVLAFPKGEDRLTRRRFNLWRPRDDRW